MQLSGAERSSLQLPNRNRSPGCTYLRQTKDLKENIFRLGLTSSSHLEKQAPRSQGRVGRTIRSEDGSAASSAPRRWLRRVQLHPKKRCLHIKMVETDEKRLSWCRCRALKGYCVILHPESPDSSFFYQAGSRTCVLKNNRLSRQPRKRHCVSIGWNRDIAMIGAVRGWRLRLGCRDALRPVEIERMRGVEDGRKPSSGGTGDPST